MTQLRQRVERLETAATTSTQYGATSNDLANFPGMMNLVAGSGVSFTPGTGTLTITATGGGGTVTSVGMSVPSFLSVSGSPVTTSGTLAVTYSGTALPIANGGSGQTTANAALNAFLPSQATHSGKVLQTDGTNTSWQTNGSGTVTSVAVSVNNGISVSGSPITTSGTFTLGLGAITPTSVSTGALTASGAISMPAGSITRANLANGSACSVVGRSANSSGVVADISMGTNDRLLGRVSNVVGSTQLTAGMVPSALITDAMLRNSAGLSVIGRPAASSGAPSDIVSTGARTFLASSAANTAVTFRAIETADFPTGDWIGANSGSGYAGSFVSIVADATWYDSGASVSLTSGTYIVTYCLRASMAITAGFGLISGRLYNVTDAAAVTNSEICVLATSFAGTTQATGSSSSVITVSGTKTIRLEAQRDAGATYIGASTRTKSDTGGRTSVSYVRIA